MTHVSVQRRDGEALQIGAAIVTVCIPKGRGRRVVLCVACPPGIDVYRVTPTAPINPIAALVSAAADAANNTLTGPNGGVSAQG